MAAAAHTTLGSRIDEMLVVAPEDAPFRTLPPSTRTIAARHPLPDAGSLVAGEAALSLALSLGKGDLFVVLLSGGGSSLLCAPAPGISLEDKSRTSALLLAAGAPIADVNAVRAALSRVKGGRLAAAAGAADVVTLVLSDLGDAGWHLVASGPDARLADTADRGARDSRAVPDRAARASVRARAPLVRARARADAAGRAALERAPRGRAHGARRRARRGAAPRHRAARRARAPLGRGARRGRPSRVRGRDRRRSAAPEVRARAEAPRDDSRRRDDRHGEGSRPRRPQPRGRARGGPRDRGGSRHRDALRGDGRRRPRAGRRRRLRRRHDARARRGARASIPRALSSTTTPARSFARSATRSLPGRPARTSETSRSFSGPPSPRTIRPPFPGRHKIPERRRGSDAGCPDRPRRGRGAAIRFRAAGGRRARPGLRHPPLEPLGLAPPRARGEDAERLGRARPRQRERDERGRRARQGGAARRRAPPCASARSTPSSRSSRRETTSAERLISSLSIAPARKARPVAVFLVTTAGRDPARRPRRSGRAIATAPRRRPAPPRVRRPSSGADDRRLSPSLRSRQEARNESRAR